MNDKDKLVRFEAARPRLMGLAYRLLGSWADAEDAVQDTFLRWQNTSLSTIASPDAWLTTACTNRCLDILKSAGRKRIDYVGPWLPEPLQTETVASPDQKHELASSLTTAFLLLLERLSPKERAAYLLREIFDHPYSEVAETLGVSEAACRQLVSRARRFVAEARVRHVPNEDQQARLLEAFRAAIETGNLVHLGALLADEVRLHADGGGKVVAATRVLIGKNEVLGFVGKVLVGAWAGYEFQVAEFNGGHGFFVRSANGPHALVTFDMDTDGCLRSIFIVRNPDKLSRADRIVRQDSATGGLSLE